MRAKHCVSCIWWLPMGDVGAPGRVIGTCKRRPPTVLAEGRQALPHMLDNDWCGDHAPLPAEGEG